MWLGGVATTTGRGPEQWDSRRSSNQRSSCGSSGQRLRRGGNKSCPGSNLQSTPFGASAPVSVNFIPCHVMTLRAAVPGGTQPQSCLSPASPVSYSLLVSRLMGLCFCFERLSRGVEKESSEERQGLQASLLSSQTPYCKRPQYIKDPFQLSLETLRKADPELAELLDGARPCEPALRLAKLV